MQSPNCSPQHASYLSQSTDDLVLPWLGPEALEPEAARPAQMMPTTHARPKRRASQGLRMGELGLCSRLVIASREDPGRQASPRTGSRAAAQRDMGAPSTSLAAGPVATSGSHSGKPDLPLGRCHAYL